MLCSALTVPPPAINYRLAPETRFPGQLHDAVSAYLRLIIDLKIPADNIVRFSRAAAWPRGNAADQSLHACRSLPATAREEDSASLS